MSATDYDKALAIWRGAAKSDKRDAGPQTEERIREAERLLDIAFPPMVRRYLKEFGVAILGAREIWGIVPDGDLTECLVPNLVGLNLHERSRFGLPDDVILIREVGNGDHYALDLGHLDADGEAPVIVWPVDGVADREDVEVVAADFGEFMLGTFEAAAEGLAARRASS